MNRLRTREEAAQPGAGPGDYFVVSTLDTNWCVSARMAGVVERAVTARWPAKWVRFVDIYGARIVVRTVTVLSVAQCYADNRAAYREFGRAHNREQKADRDWEE